MAVDLTYLAVSIETPIFAIASIPPLLPCLHVRSLCLHIFSVPHHIPKAGGEHFRFNSILVWGPSRIDDAQQRSMTSIQSFSLCKGSEMSFYSYGRFDFPIEAVYFLQPSFTKVYLNVNFGCMVKQYSVSLILMCACEKGSFRRYQI